MFMTYTGGTPVHFACQPASRIRRLRSPTSDSCHYILPCFVVGQLRTLYQYEYDDKAMKMINSKLAYVL